MDKLAFAAMCFYYYGYEFFRLMLLTVAAMAGAFMIHKLVSWALWVMSL